jgi:tetratricopeptide (TPR) repeat protein
MIEGPAMNKPNAVARPSGQARIAEELRTAQRHSAQQQWPAAEAAYKRVLRAAPDRAEAWDGLGFIAYRNKRHEEAERCFRRAQELQPGIASYNEHLAAALRGLKRAEEALPFYERALAIEPNNGGTLSNFGNALVDAGRLEDAAKSFTKAVALRPDQAGFRINFARCLLKLKRGDEALAQLEEARRLEPSSTVEMDLGNAYIQLERYEEAVAAYRKAEALGHNDHEMFHNLGTALQYLPRCNISDAWTRPPRPIRPRSRGGPISRRRAASSPACASTRRPARRSRG